MLWTSHNADFLKAWHCWADIFCADIDKSTVTMTDTYWMAYIHWLLLVRMVALVATDLSSTDADGGTGCHWLTQAAPGSNIDPTFPTVCDFFPTFIWGLRKSFQKLVLFSHRICLVCCALTLGIQILQEVVNECSIFQFPGSKLLCSDPTDSLDLGYCDLMKISWSQRCVHFRQ